MKYFINNFSVYLVIVNHYKVQFKNEPVNDIELISSYNSTNAIFYYLKPRVYFPFETLS